MPLWWKSKKVHVPWQNDFNILPVIVPDPPTKEPVIYIVPSNMFLHLLSVNFTYALPGFSAAHYIIIKFLRGGVVMQTAPSNYPGSVAETHPITFFHGALLISNRGDGYPQTTPLPGQIYLYPNDEIHIDAIYTGPFSLTYTDITLTFRQWITD